ncbi:hypothetical protein FACS1894186_4170 [Alphaproteobacteria bacterium]|nr:hypothetical protein FACS1894186_4170 [Alphaproteobacteria bacterium]
MDSTVLTPASLRFSAALRDLEEASAAQARRAKKLASDNALLTERIAIMQRRLAEADARLAALVAAVDRLAGDSGENS